MLNDNNVSKIQFSQAFGLKSPIGLAFVLCFVYWFYLFFTAQAIIVFDAMWYEGLGKMIYHSGWIEFFRTGPNNEPVFPLLIALSMRVGDFFSISYQIVQTCLQISILFFSQLLTLLVLKKLHISQWVKALIILYMGFSPALVNATFALFSEIAAFPLILGIILISVKSWGLILSNKYKKVILYGVYLAFIFVVLTLTKALFEYIFIAFMAPYLVLMFKSIFKRERKAFVSALLFLVVTSFLFNACLFSYKSLNQKYNGHFMLTDRGPYILYGNIAKRAEPLTLQRFLSSLAVIPGDGVCYKLLNRDDCAFWSGYTAEKYGRPKLKELESQSVPNSEIDSVMVNLAKEKMLERPFQQTFLLFIESFKMLFWESTNLGYVSYPPWLQKIYDFTIFKNGLRLLLFLITSTSMVYTLCYTTRSRNHLFFYQNAQNGEVCIFFFILVLITSYTGLYSLFMIATRYATPIAPLYLIMIGFTIQKMILR